jgi:hypothetical protein
VAHCCVARHCLNVVLVEDLRNEAHALVHVQALAVEARDARALLAAWRGGEGRGRERVGVNRGRHYADAGREDQRRGRGIQCPNPRNRRHSRWFSA